MVEAWNADHPDEKVTAQEIPAGKTSEEVIGAAITAGNAPCLVFNTSPAAVPQFQKQGGLVALDGFDGGTDYIEERTGDVAEQYKSPDGKYYQMPWKSNPVMIFYNKDLMKKAGVDPENPPLATYDEFLDTSQQDRRQRRRAGRHLARRRPASSSSPGSTSTRCSPPRPAAQQLVEDGKATFDSDGGQGGRRLLGDDVRRGARAEGGVQRRLVRRREGRDGDRRPVGDRGLRRDGQLGRRPGPDLRRHQRRRRPTPSPTPRTSALYSACENQGTAWDVLKFATSEEQDGKLLEMTGQMPLRTDLEGTYPDYFKENPEYEAFADQAARTVEVPNVPNSIEIWQTFRDAYSDVRDLRQDAGRRRARRARPTRSTELAGQS